MFSFIAAVFSAVWIQEHWKELLIGFVVLIALLANYSARKKRQREAYLALPVLYIGNRSTRVYHTLNCSKTSNLSPGNTVAFRSANEVLQSGYKPCGNCCPRL